MRQVLLVSNEKLAKLLEQHEEAKAVGLELIGREELMRRLQKKADELIVAYDSERKKRSKFQYDIGVHAKKVLIAASPAPLLG